MSQNFFSLFIIVVVGFVLLAMILSKPYLGLAFTVASLPLYYMTFLPSGFNFTSITGILGGVTLVSYVFNRRKNHYLRNERETLKKISSKLYLPIFLLLVEIIIWDLFVPFRLDRLYFVTYIQLILLVWLAEQILIEQSHLEILMKIFIFVNLVALLFALRDFDFFAENTLQNRLSGYTGNANAFSLYLGISVLFLMYFFENTVNRKSKVLLFGVGFSMFVPILLSGSRGGFLFLVVALAYQIWRFKRGSLIFIGGLFLLALFNSTVLASGYFEKMLEIPTSIATQSDTIGLRISLWLYGIELWKTSPLFGIGTGMFYFRSIFSPVLNGRKRLVAHSTYVTYLVDNGLVGLLLFLIILVGAVLNYEKAIRFFTSRNPQIEKLAITWQAVLLIYALNSFKGSLNIDKIFWLTFGISLVFSRWVSDANSFTKKEKISVKA